MLGVWAIVCNAAIILSPSNPYDNQNKLNPSYINYDSTHAPITQAQVNTLNTMGKIVYDDQGYIGIDYGE